MTVYAYLRVSTKGQTTDNQRLKIKAEECLHIDEWVVEHAVSGSICALERPQFSTLIANATKGDTVVAVSLDRIGRDTEDVLHTIRMFNTKGVHLRVVELNSTDLTSDTGKLLVILLSAVAEMERNKCITRTEAGLARAKEEGRVFGRYLTITPATLNLMRNDQICGMSYRELSEKFKINKDTIAQTLKKWEGKFEEYEEIWTKQRQQKLNKQRKEKGTK